MNAECEACRAPAPEPTPQEGEEEDPCYWCDCEGVTPQQLLSSLYAGDLERDGTCANAIYNQNGQAWGMFWEEPSNEELQSELDDMHAICVWCRGDDDQAPAASQPQEEEQVPVAEGIPPSVIMEEDLFANPPGPFLGVVADGMSYLDIALRNNDPNRRVSVSISQPSLGTLANIDGSGLDMGGDQHRALRAGHPAIYPIRIPTPGADDG